MVQIILSIQNTEGSFDMRKIRAMLASVALAGLLLRRCRQPPQTRGQLSIFRMCQMELVIREMCYVLVTIVVVILETAKKYQEKMAGD